jgi:hypothetical protein
MFAGAFLYAVTHGHSHVQAAQLANLAAAQVVSQYGNRLTQAAMADVKARFQPTDRLNGARVSSIAAAPIKGNPVSFFWSDDAIRSRSVSGTVLCSTTVDLPAIPVGLAADWDRDIHVAPGAGAWRCGKPVAGANPQALAGLRSLRRGSCTVGGAASVFWMCLRRPTLR